MPAERSTRAQPHKDLNKALRPPRVINPLPDAVFDRLDAGRNNNEPYRFTTSDVKAIVRYVSTPRVDADTPVLPNINWDAVKHARKAARRTAANHLGETRRLAREAARDAALAGPSQTRALLDRLSTAPATPAPQKPKPVLLDFSKLSHTDLVGIFKPKLAAVLKRLEPFHGDLRDLLLDNPHRHTFNRLHARIVEIQREWAIPSTIVTFEEWTRWKVGLEEIGEIKFNQLRANFTRVLKELNAVYNRGRFD